MVAPKPQDLRPNTWGERCARSAVVLICLGIAPISSAQVVEEHRLPARPIPIELLQLVAEPGMIVLTEEHLQEADAWAREFDAWQQWADRWFNRRQPGLLSTSVERTKRPDPPVWLGDVCALLGDDDRLARPCALFDDWRQAPLMPKSLHAAAAVPMQKEAPKKSVWWRHLHVDGLWSTTQTNASVFALFGMHATIEIHGRMQIFAAPGILLMSVPNLYGNRELRPATDWGMTYRLFDFRSSTVHFNLVRAWVLASQATPIESTMTLAGFSVSFRPRQP
jgi:hypothetical protein